MVLPLYSISSINGNPVTAAVPFLFNGGGEVIDINADAILEQMR